MICNRCQRNHSGVCGIPLRNASETNKAGKISDWVNSNTGSWDGDVSRYVYEQKNKSKKNEQLIPKETLEKIISEGRKKRDEILNTLKSLSSEFPEYDQLLKGLDKVERVLSEATKELYSRWSGGAF